MKVAQHAAGLVGWGTAVPFLGWQRDIRCLGVAGNDDPRGGGLQQGQCVGHASMWDSLGEALAWWRVVLTTEKDLSSLSPFVPPTILRQRLGAYAQLFLVGVGGAPIALSLVQW
uniref:Uncharacterized protein n=1 Tax=Oryza nivara TaxID=4536 RepID=A0A0E0IH66_ORYNI